MAFDPTPFPDDMAMLVAVNARALDLDAQIANLKLHDCENAARHLRRFIPARRQARTRCITGHRPTGSK